MKLSVKTWLYEGLAAGFTALAASLCAALSSADELAAQNGLQRTTSALFLLGCVLLGGALYVRRAFARERRDLLADVWFAAAVGVVFLVLAVAEFFAYGGLVSVLSEAGARARNGMIVAASAMPLPFWGRGAVLSVFGKEELSRRRWRLVGTAALFVLYVLLIVFGVLMHTVPVEVTA